MNKRTGYFICLIRKNNLFSQLYGQKYIFFRKHSLYKPHLPPFQEKITGIRRTSRLQNINSPLFSPNIFYKTDSGGELIMTNKIIITLLCLGIYTAIPANSTQASQTNENTQEQNSSILNDKKEKLKNSQNPANEKQKEYQHFFNSLRTDENKKQQLAEQINQLQSEIQQIKQKEASLEKEKIKKLY